MVLVAGLIEHTVDENSTKENPTKDLLEENHAVVSMVEHDHLHLQFFQFVEVELCFL